MGRPELRNRVHGLLPLGRGAGRQIFSQLLALQRGQTLKPICAERRSAGACSDGRAVRRIAARRRNVRLRAWAGSVIYLRLVRAPRRIIFPSTFSGETRAFR